MLQYPKITLLKGKEISIIRKHHWIFSGAIDKKDSNLENGQLVQVFSAREIFLGIGHYQNGSIMVRMISFEEAPIDLDFWEKRIGLAFAMRKSLLLTDSQETNVYRLIHAEGDGLPGLIIDFYNGTAVIQAHSIGMVQHFDDLSKALQKVYGDGLTQLADLWI